MIGLDEIVNKDIFYLIKSGLYRLIDGVDMALIKEDKEEYQHLVNARKQLIEEKFGSVVYDW